MINKKQSQIVKSKFLEKLNDYIKKDEKERKLIITLMISSFIISLIFTAISSFMIYTSFKKSVPSANTTNYETIEEGENKNE